MKQWNGLVRKEWVMMKWPLLVSALLATVVMLFFPLLITRLIDADMHVFDVALVICFLWAGASVLAPIVALLTMLGREMRQPDVWLHSNASIFKLVGTKVFLAAMIGAVGLLIPTLALAIHYTFSKSVIFSFNELFFFGTIFIVMLFAISLVLMSLGFFFWVIDRLLKPYIKGFSTVVTFVLFVLLSRGYGEFIVSDFYKQFVRIGPIDLMAIKNPMITMDFIYFQHTKTVFYTGEILFETIATVILFIVAAFLFEKKVRL